MSRVEGSDILKGNRRTFVFHSKLFICFPRTAASALSLRYSLLASDDNDFSKVFFHVAGCYCHLLS